MKQVIHDLVANVDELASLPGICGRVTALVDDPKSTIKELAQVISQDPGLSVKLLRIANSAFYGRVKGVETVEQALSVIGMQRVRDMVLGTAALDAFNGIPNDLVSMENFWMHSLYCAIASRLLAKKIRNPRAESIFVAGLLHDIGQLVLFHKRPEASRQALLLSIEDVSELDIVDAEQQVFGFDHCQIGAVLAEQWSLPDMLFEAILYHHAPEKATAFEQEVALVHISNILACMAELDQISTDDIDRIHPVAWELVGLDAKVIPEIVHEMQAQFTEVKNLFLS